MTKCSPHRGPRDYHEDYIDIDVDCNNYEIGREGVKMKHHVVSHQLHDETKRKRTVPDSQSKSADARAFAKGCRDRPPRDYNFDDYLEDYLVPEKFLLLRDYFLNYPLPDCPTEDDQKATTPSLPSFSTVNDDQ